MTLFNWIKQKCIWVNLSNCQRLRIRYSIIYPACIKSLYTSGYLVIYSLRDILISKPFGVGGNPLICSQAYSCLGSSRISVCVVWLVPKGGWVNSGTLFMPCESRRPNRAVVCVWGSQGCYRTPFLTLIPPFSCAMKEPHSLPPPPPNHHSRSPPAPLFQQKRLAEGVSVVWAYGKLEDPPPPCFC